jgi:hypothetical protein
MCLKHVSTIIVPQCYCSWFLLKLPSFCTMCEEESIISFGSISGFSGRFNERIETTELS